MNPSIKLPDICFGIAGLDCLQKPKIDASANTISFVMRNNLGSDINIK